MAEQPEGPTPASNADAIVRLENHVNTLGGAIDELRGCIAGLQTGHQATQTAAAKAVEEVNKLKPATPPTP